MKSIKIIKTKTIKVGLQNVAGKFFAIITREKIKVDQNMKSGTSRENQNWPFPYLTQRQIQH